ncbi:PAS domain-containing protein [Bacteroidota bacterium]
MDKLPSHKDLQKRILHLEKELTQLKSQKDSSGCNNSAFYSICEHSKNAVALFETSDNGENFSIKYFNKIAGEIEKIKRETVIDKNIIDVFPSVLTSGFIDALKRVFQLSIPEEFPAKVFSSGKIIDWKQNYIYKLSDTEVVSIYIDETEHKTKDYELKEHREKLQIAMEATNYYSFEIDLTSEKITTNKNVYVDLGYTDSEINQLMQKSGSLIHPDDFKNIQKILSERSKNIKPAVYTEYRVKHKNGNWVWFMSTGKIVDWNENSESMRFIGLSKNIQQEKEMLLKLKENERRLKLAMESARQSLVDWDIKKNHVYFSPEWYKMLEYKEDEITVNYDFIISIAHPDDVPATFRKLKALIAEETDFFNAEIRMKTKSGNWKWISTLGKIVERNSKGEPLRALGVQGDISDQKRLISELSIAKEKAEESDRLKSAFLANMSHEIRTPMNGILGFAELLKDNITEAEKLNYLRIIDSNGKQLLGLINDIIDVAKIEAGEISINKTVSEIKPILDNIYQTFCKEQIRLQKQDIEFKFSIPDNLNDVIFTDIDRLQQILNNLLINAFKFTDSGSISFGYKKIISNVLSYYQFFVADTGIGISEKMQEDIFERFRQVRPKKYKNKHGTGLGLSITKGLIELLEGEIWVESKLEELSQEIQGKSTFYFTIPIVNNTN